MARQIEALWVLYDETCGFCCLCANWLRAQDKLVSLSCLPRGGEVARRVFPGLPWGHDELVVIDSGGGVYRGGDAFVMALWALDDFRGWALRASHEPLRSRARSLFHWLSSRLHDVSKALRARGEGRADHRSREGAGCHDGQCSVDPEAESGA